MEGGFGGLEEFRDGDLGSVRSSTFFIDPRISEGVAGGIMAHQWWVGSGCA